MLQPLVFWSLLFATACAAADFAWQSTPTHFPSLAESEDSASCCGCEAVSDPAYREDGLSCPCDATAGACDAGCCCDSADCTLAELTDLFGCDAAGAASRPPYSPQGERSD